MVEPKSDLAVLQVVCYTYPIRRPTPIVRALKLLVEAYDKIRWS
jgi:hypothetical protein